MPTVPVETNMVGIAQATDAKLRPADYAGSGLQTFGAGLHDVGQGAGEIAKAWDEQRQMLETAAAKMLDTELMQSATAADEQFKGLQGTNATNGLHDYLASIERLGQETLQRATSDRQRRLLAPIVAERTASAVDSAMTHARQQAMVALDEATNARIGASRNAYLAASTDQDRDMNLATGRTDIQHYWDGKGNDPLVGREKARTWASGALTARASHLIDTNDIVGAQAFIEQHRAQFVGDDYDRVTAALTPVVERSAAEADVDKVQGVAGPGGAAQNFTDPLRGAGRGPVPGGEYGASRDYGSHKGLDSPAPIGTPVYSGHGPGIATVTHSPLGGNIVTITHGDGYRTKYDHLGRVAIADGARVDATTVLGQVGVTGRTTGPNLHYEVFDAHGNHVDPSHVATAIRQGPQAPDINAGLSAIDAIPGLTPQQRDMRKQIFMSRVGISNAIREQQYQQADEAAAKALLALPPRGFTSIGQIPASIRSALRPEKLLALRESADANLKALAVGPSANGPTVTLLHRLQYEDPAAFAQRNLELDRGRVSSGEFDELSSEQAKLRAKPQEGAKYSDVFTTIHNFGGGVLGPQPKAPPPDADPSRPSSASHTYQAWEQNRIALADHMRRYIDRLQRYDPNFKPTDDTYRKAYEDATLRSVQADGTYQYRYKLNSPRTVSMSQADEARIRAQLTAQHITPTPDTIMRVYLNAAVRSGQ